jgi:uncharacterized protein YndB with AHSA1/START domain
VETLTYETTIQATPSAVWHALWSLDNYSKWTAPFTEGSKAETDDWKEGTKVLFTDGKGSGMVSTVAVNKPNAFMSFKHIGMVKDGVEDTESEEVKKWAPSTENYTLAEAGTATTLRVDLQVMAEWKAYMEEKWPLALDVLKKLAEA